MSKKYKKANRNKKFINENIGNMLVTIPIWKLTNILNDQFDVEYSSILEGQEHIEFDNFGTYDVLKNVYYGEDMIIYE